MCQPANKGSLVLCPRCLNETRDLEVFRPKWRKRRMKVLVRDNFRCQYPGCTCENLALLTVHHVKPKSQGGKSRLNNLTTLCQFHHAMLHDTLPKQGCDRQHDLSGIHEFTGVVYETPVEISH